jgi:hypothetical protein
MNLKNMLVDGEFNNTLELKVFLIKHKKTGHLFYLPDMASLDVEVEFDLFYYLSKPSGSEKEAFPIPRSIFKENISEEHLKRLYEAYYCTDHLPKLDYFHNLKVYKGSDWVWFYDNQYWRDSKYIGYKKMLH